MTKKVVIQNRESVLQVLENMPYNQLLLVRGRLTESGDKLYLEFAEKVIPNGAVVSALGAFNKSDSRFNTSKFLLRAWMSVEKPDAEEILGIDLSDIPANADEWTWYGTTHHVVAGGLFAGKGIHVRIWEEQEVKDSDWSATNQDGLVGPAVTAKQDGNGNYCLKDGNPIFRRDDVIFADEPVFEPLAHDTMGNLPIKFTIGKEGMSEQIASAYALEEENENN